MHQRETRVGRGYDKIEYIKVVYNYWHSPVFEAEKALYTRNATPRSNQWTLLVVRIVEMYWKNLDDIVKGDEKYVDKEIRYFDPDKEFYAEYNK